MIKFVFIIFLVKYECTAIKLLKMPKTNPLNKHFKLKGVEFTYLDLFEFHTNLEKFINNRILAGISNLIIKIIYK